MAKEDDDLIGDVLSFLKSRRLAAEVSSQNPEPDSPQQLAVRMEKLVQAVSILPARRYPGYSLTRERISGVNRTCLIVETGQDESDKKPSRIVLDAWEDSSTTNTHPLLALPGKVNVATNSLVRIGKHLDKATAAQITLLLNGRTIIPSELETIFLFAQDGSHAKVSAIPRAVLDPRPDLGEPELRLKYLQSTIDEGDLQLVNASVRVFEGLILK